MRPGTATGNRRHTRIETHRPSQEQVPTSAFLGDILNDAPGEMVSIGWIMEQLGNRSFGLTLFVMAIVAVIPGGSTVIGVLIAWPALQLALGRRMPRLPGFLARRQIAVDKLSRAIRFVIPRLRWVEKLIKPRWITGFTALRRLTGLLTLLLGLTLISPFPFSHLIPAVTIMLLAIAFLEEDGIALLFAVGLGLASLTLSATQIWGAVEFAEWIDRLLN